MESCLDQTLMLSPDQNWLLMRGILCGCTIAEHCISQSYCVYVSTHDGQTWGLLHTCVTGLWEREVSVGYPNYKKTNNDLLTTLYFSRKQSISFYICVCHIINFFLGSDSSCFYSCGTYIRTYLFHVSFSHPYSTLSVWMQTVSEVKIGVSFKWHSNYCSYTIWVVVMITAHYCRLECGSTLLCDRIWEKSSYRIINLWSNVPDTGAK